MKSLHSSPLPENPVASDPNQGEFAAPVSEDSELTQTSVINTLLSHKRKPNSAVNYFKWAERERGFVRGVDAVCVLLHILMGNPKTHGRAKMLLNQYVSGNSGVFVDHLVDCAKRFDFELESQVFGYLLNNYVRANRIECAIDCFSRTLELEMYPCVTYVNILLTELVRRNMMGEAREVYDKMALRGIGGDRVTLQVMMRGCLKQGKPDDAEEYFREARAREVELDAASYSVAIEAFCKKPNSCSALELLDEMREMGWVPSVVTFSSVITACVKQRNMVEAIRIKDGMVSCGYPVNLVAATSLMKGYCVQGNLESALGLFSMIIEDGLTPDRVTYAILIEYCCKNGNMEKAYELYTQMKDMDIFPDVFINGDVEHVFDDMVAAKISPTGFTVGIVIDGLCKAGRTSEASDMLKKIVARGFIPGCVSYNSIINGYTKEGDINSALAVYREMCEGGVSPNVVTYTSIINGFCISNQIDMALKMWNEMENKGIELELLHIVL
ncbi:hypothetical protein ACFX10_009868 [Malus domestica]